MYALPKPRTLVFLLGMWLLGRAIVFAAVATHSERGAIDALVHWDGAWYGSIVQHGYEFARDGREHNLAFFPLFPLLATLLVRVGIPWPIAGVAINNVGALAALVAVCAFVERRMGEGAARWSVAVIALMPLALFTVAAYSEGVYLCFSALALYDFECGRTLRAGLASALAAVTRPIGAALAVSLLLEGIRGRRARVVAAGFIASTGILAFAFYCWRAFGDPLAFATAQHAWRSSFGFDWAAWWAILQMSFTGWKLAASIVAAAAIVAVVRRDNLDALSLLLGCAAVGLESWVWSYNACTILLLAIGLVATIAFRERLGRLPVLYAIVACLVLLASGTPFSVDRNAYAIVPLDIAIALVAQRYPALGYPALAAMAVGLAVDAAAFARWQWVA